MADAGEGMTKRALVVDDDQSVMMATQRLLESSGYDVTCCAQAVEAWDLCLSEGFGLIVLDWNLAEISGAALLSRLRQLDQYKAVPILIVSGFLDRNDLALIDDFLHCAALTKPFETTDLDEAVEALLDEIRWLDSHRGAISELMASVRQSSSEMVDLGQVEKLVKDAPSHRIYVAVAQLLMAGGLDDDAETLLRLAMTKNDASVAARTELAKLQFRQGKLRSARTLLESDFGATDTQSIERLVTLGYVSLEEMSTDEAKSFFEDALEIDAQNEAALNGLSAAEDLSSFARDRQSTAHSVPSTLNMMGISMVLDQKLEEGVRYYKAALDMLRTSALKAKVSFNIGYARKRQGNHSEAAEWFRKALDLDPELEKASGALSRNSRTTDVQVEDGASFDYSMNMEEMDMSAEDFGAEEPVDEVEESSLEQVTRATFSAECPLIDQFLDMASRQGVYLEGQLPEMYSLYKDAGDDRFNQVLGRLVSDQTPSVSQLKSALEAAAA